MKIVLSLAELYLMGMLPIFLLFGSKGGKAVHDFNMKAIGGIFKFLTVWPAKAIHSGFVKARTSRAAHGEPPATASSSATHDVTPREDNVVNLDDFRAPATRRRPTASTPRAEPATVSSATGERPLPPELDPAYGGADFCDLAVMEKRKMYEEYL